MLKDGEFSRGRAPGLGMLTDLRGVGGFPCFEVKSGKVALKSEGKLIFAKPWSSVKSNHFLHNPEEGNGP